MALRDSVSATIKLELAPWPAPNYARRVTDDESSEAIPVQELDNDALENMALAWVRDLYRKANRQFCPFTKPVGDGSLK